MRTSNLAIGAVFASLGLSSLVGCGSDLTCGPGTSERGETCVAVEAAAGSDGGGVGGADGGDGETAPSFDGVTSLAPASDVALQVTWEAALDDTTETESISYRVYVATATGEQNFGRPTAVSPPGASALVVANLEPGSQYFVVVRAVDADGNEDANTTELQGTPETDTSPPVFAGATAADAFGSNSVEVSWEPAQDDKTPELGMSYTVRWSDQPGAAATLGSVGVLTPPGATSAIVHGLPAPVSTYYFYVQAHDAAGNVDENAVTVAGDTGPDVTPPLFGGCAAVGEPGATRATAAWSPASDDTTAPEEIAYNIYAFNEPVDEGTPFGAAVGTVVGGELGVAEGLKPKTTYYVVCRAADKTGNEDQNISFRQVVTKEDGSAPVFTGIGGVVPDSTTAELSWSAATDDQTDQGEIQYLVYQSTAADPVSSGVLITPGPGPGATSFTVTNLESRKQYYWTVRASDRAGNIDENAEVATEITLVSFANDVQRIFTASCAKTSCHLGEEAMQGMRLEEGYAYTHTVGAPSAFETERNEDFPAPRLNRIEPGNRERSLLWHKINNTVSLGKGFVGQPMPKDTPGQKIPEPDLATIDAWILQGARNN